MVMSVLLTATTPAPPVAVTRPPIRCPVPPMLMAPVSEWAPMPVPLEVTVEVVSISIVPAPPVVARMP